MSDHNTIGNIIASLTQAQLKRLEAIQSQVRVELARNYGDRLAPIMAEVLVQESTTHQDVLAAIEGIRDCMPATPDDWRLFVQRLVQNNEMAQRNLAFSGETRREEIRAEEMAKLRPDQRVNLSRSGKLDATLDERVSMRLEAGL